MSASEHTQPWNWLQNACINNVLNSTHPLIKTPAVQRVCASLVWVSIEERRMVTPKGKAQKKKEKRVLSIKMLQK